MEVDLRLLSLEAIDCTPCSDGNETRQQVDRPELRAVPAVVHGRELQPRPSERIRVATSGDPLEGARLRRPQPRPVELVGSV